MPPQWERQIEIQMCTGPSCGDRRERVGTEMGISWGVRHYHKKLSNIFRAYKSEGLLIAYVLII